MISTNSITLPLINTLKIYQKKWFRRDIVAGITVAAVAVPQAMAYAQLAGLPLVTGLYAALLAMLLFALFTTSRFAIVGPDAAMAALTGAAIIPLAGGDIARYTSLVSVLAVLIGAICLVALFARLGVIAEFISRPILLGYMGGLALAVIASQAPKLFGITIPPEGNFFTTIWYILSHLGESSWPTVLLSSIILASAVALQRYAKKIPMSLVVLVAAIVASAAFSLQDKGIAVVGMVPTGLPLPVWPTLTILDLQSLVVPALMIALVSYANTIATERTFASHQKENIEAPQEFFGLGIANIGSGIFGGMPVAASGARTAVNHGSKAVTQVSQLFGALFIALVLLFLAPMLSYLPLAALAVIVIMAVKNLFNYKELKSIWHAWHTEALLAIVTLLGVTILGIFQGLLLAVLLAVINLVRKNTLPKYAVLGIAENGAVRDMSRPPKTTALPGMIIFRFDAPLYFINASYFRDTVYELIEKSEEPITWFLWDAETITEVDSTAGQMLLVLMRDLKSKGITFAIARMKGPIRETVGKSRRLSRTISAAPHFTSMGHAIEAYKDISKTEETK
ncbi:sulfate permease [Candidatus Saccharibacteria bacterium]|nr:sulfate permease [Candidatus Saccharibacteria bacterium]